MVNLIDIRILLKVVTNAYVIAILRSLHPKCEMLIGTWDDKKGSSSGYSLWDRHSLLLIKHWLDIMKVVSKTWSSSAKHWLMDLMRCWKHGPWSLSHIAKGPREKSVRLKKPDNKARQIQTGKQGSQSGCFCKRQEGQKSLYSWSLLPDMLKR
jgi:hypothetical protein